MAAKYMFVFIGGVLAHPPLSWFPRNRSAMSCKEKVLGLAGIACEWWHSGVHEQCHAQQGNAGLHMREADGIHADARGTAAGPATLKIIILFSSIQGALSAAGAPGRLHGRG